LLESSISKSIPAQRPASAVPDVDFLTDNTVFIILTELFACSSLVFEFQTTSNLVLGVLVQIQTLPLLFISNFVVPSILISILVCSVLFVSSACRYIFQSTQLILLYGVPDASESANLI
jgi:hypothetical protein